MGAPLKLASTRIIEEKTFLEEIDREIKGL